MNEPLLAIFFLLSSVCYSNQTTKRTDTTEALLATGTRRSSQKWIALSLVCYALAHGTGWVSSTTDSVTRRKPNNASDRAIAIDTNSANVHLYLGLALYDQGQIDQSLDELRHGLEINADTPKAHYGIGLGLRPIVICWELFGSSRLNWKKSPENPDAKKQIANIEEKLK